MLMSERQEIELGQQTDQQIIREYGIYTDAELSGKVSDMGRQLAALSHRPHLPYDFKILDSPVVNAFAVPGGHVYFTRGILASLNSDAELAGVMGHEIGHITARHSAEQYSRAQLAQIGLSVGMVISETFRVLGGLAQTGVSMLFLSFSRDNEREADALGVEYASKGGYDAAHMADFFETLERQSPASGKGGLPSWFSTHPSPEDRQGAIRRDATRWRKELGGKDLKVEREGYLRAIDGLVFGEDPRQGFVEKGVFYHPGLRFQFPVPQGWSVVNSPASIQMAPEKRDAVVGFSLSSAPSPDEAAKVFVEKSRAKVVQSFSERVDQYPARRLVTQLSTKQGQAGIMSSFIQKENKVYVFHALTSVSRFDGFRPTFEGILTGLKNLTDPQKLSVKPYRLKVRTAPVTGSLRQNLRALGTAEERLEELAILNGARLEDRIEAGALLKVVEKGG
jgi:predicted Zn-dependent protease